MRSITITRADFDKAGPMGVVEKMEAAGFVFALRSCPFQLGGKYTVSADPSAGSVTYTQEEAGPDGR